MSDPIAELLKHEYGSIDLEDSDWVGMAKQIRQQIEPEVVQRCIDAGCEYLRQCALNRLSPTQSGLEKALEAQK